MIYGCMYMNTVDIYYIYKYKSAEKQQDVSLVDLRFRYNITVDLLRSDIRIALRKEGYQKSS